METYIEQLNDAQRAPVLQKEGAMIVIAGAGSGKTRVLTFRIAYLISIRCNFISNARNNAIYLAFNTRCRSWFFQSYCFREGAPRIIFTASVKNTNNAYDDREVLGSFIGIIAIQNDAVSGVYSYCTVPATETNLKVELITVASKETEVIFITDADKENSILLKSVLVW